MTRPARLAFGSFAIVALYVHYACAARLSEYTSGEKGGDLRSKLSASYGFPDNGFHSTQIYPRKKYDWDRNTTVKTKGTVKVTTLTYDEGATLAKWVIAIIVIVPLLIIIGIVVLIVCVCRIATRKTVHTTAYMHQEGPPVYPQSVGTQMNRPV